MNNKQGPALCILGFISLIHINVWAAQPLSEGALATQTGGEFKHEVRQFQKPYDNQQAEQISLMV